VIFLGTVWFASPTMTPSRNDLVAGFSTVFRTYLARSTHAGAAGLAFPLENHQRIDEGGYDGGAGGAAAS